jgi:hypothetical protein
VLASSLANEGHALSTGRYEVLIQELLPPHRPASTHTHSQWWARAMFISIPRLMVHVLPSSMPQ